MLKAIKSLFDPSKPIIKSAEKRLPEIKAKQEELEGKSTEEIARIISNHKKALYEISDRISAGEKNSVRMRRKAEKLNVSELELYKKVQEILPEVYAALSIATKRKYGISHFDVQFLAGTILASGQKLVEMKTGEGKTITFQLPLFLYGLTGRGAHLVTVNDYLARRDGEYAGHIFAELGVTVGIITPQASYRFVKDEDLLEVKGEKAAQERNEIKKLTVSSLRGTNLIACSKKEAYESDIVYGTNNEFGFDYLRDNMANTLDARVQRELYFCIVDEADSILIDEARTPLIISAPANSSNDLYRNFASLVKNLKEGDDYTIEEKEKAANLTDTGIEKMERLLGVKNIWENYELAHHVENALKAKVFFLKDEEYIVRDGEVVIVDEFTGRVLAGRRYSEGLHQAIEAKEGVKIQQESRTLATITFQNFFRLYKILTGGSGTILTEQEEFFKIYNLEAAAIPTNKNMIRKDSADRIFKNKAAKFAAVVAEIARAHESGQPILIGTTSIADSELVSNGLSKLSIEHEVLNAKLHEREAMIVAKAGAVGAVTVATNMAGRGTDIPLGEGAVDAGGLYVIGTERHESRRIDNQLRGRAGRQGDPGESRFYVALDDQIMRIQGGEVIQRLMTMTNLPDEMPLESRMITGAIERAQKRMEGMYFDARKHVVEYDDVINQQREIFYSRRLRILEIADSFNDEDLSAEKIVALKSEITKEYLKAASAQSKSYATEISNTQINNPKELDETISKIVDTLLGQSLDKYFIAAANTLKIYSSEITNTEELKEAITKRLKDISANEADIFNFTDNLLRVAIETRLDKVSNLSNVLRATFLEVMDELWTLHLDYMQGVREGIGLRGVAQLNPLVEYKNEGFSAFQSFIEKINGRALQTLLQISDRGINELNPSEGQVLTNVEQIKDMLTGTRELGSAADKVLRETKQHSKNTRVVARNNSNETYSNLSRRQRRQMERENKKKR